jgi:diguanylate cyclase (GGDEF)-like protein/PAS domain S-box-containing protein
MKPNTDLRHDGTVPDGTQTVEQLRRFRAAMDMSGDAIYLVDRATMRFIDVNQTACARTGYTREELLRMGPQDLMKTGREDLERGYDEVIAAGEQGITTESTAHYKDGRKSQAELHRRALRTGDGWIIVSIARDITRRKRTERAARQIGRMYAALSATNEAILRARLPGELYQQVCDAAVFGGKLISTSVLVPGRDGPSVEIVAIAGRGEEQLRGTHISVDESIAEGRGLVGIAFRMLQPCVSNDYLNDERTRLWHETARAVGVMAGAAVPLVRGGRAVGVLLFYSDEKGAFDEEVVKLLQRMAENIAFALDNFEREAERKRGEEALRESEERFRSLTSLTSDFYWETDTEHRIAAVTHGPQRRTVVPKDSQTGRARWEMPSTRPDEAGWTAHKAMLDARLPFRNFQFARLGQDGTERHLSITGEPAFDAAGNFKGYRGIGTDITERKQAEQRIEYLATHDELTGLPNRVMFGQLLKLAIESARRHGRKFAVLFIDLDGFKTVNDRLGHEAGDALLKRISARLTDCLRASDVVARQGGDEFVVLVQEVTDTGEVAAVARKILSGVIEPASLGGQDCGVTASVGISMYPADAHDENTLMNSADIAMYLAKERGKNNFQFVSCSIEMPRDPLRALAR